MKQIRQIIGPSATLHIQLVGQNVSEMLDDAQTIFEQVDSETYIKVPTTLTGLEVIKRLKQAGHNVTATAIYTKLQGLLAISAGADYIAPYYNRMQNMGINAPEVIKEFADAIKRNGAQTEILAASFHNVDQITTALASGAQAVTVDPALVATGLNHPAIQQAVNDFTNDWESTFGIGQTITSLLN